MLIIILIIVSVVVIYYAVQELKRQREEERKRAMKEKERQERMRQQQEKNRQERERKERIRQQQEKEKQQKKAELGRKYPNMTEIAKEFITEHINPNDILDCTSENRVSDYDTTICKFPIKLKDSKVEKNHILDATIHFLYNPNTKENSVVLFCKCIYHFNIHARGRTPEQLMQFKVVVEETEKRCGYNSAFIDTNWNICSSFEAHNVNVSQVKNTVLELKNNMQKLASLLYDFCINNF